MEALFLTHFLIFFFSISLGIFGILDIILNLPLFNNPIMSFMMRVLDVIPVYRSQDDQSQTHRNIDSFSECYKILEKKKCILFFPEGVSLGERVLFKIKSGASRVGLRCEEENDFNLDRDSSISDVRAVIALLLSSR